MILETIVDEMSQEECIGLRISELKEELWETTVFKGKAVGHAS
jgi:hypothetical protein